MHVAPLRKTALNQARGRATSGVGVSSKQRIRRNLMRVISGPWWSWLLRGIAAIVFGVLAMVWPGITFLAFVAMFAAYALIDGVLHLTAAFRAHQGQPRWLLALQGILGIAVAALTFVWPGIPALGLLFLIGAWAIVGGAM